MAGKVVNRGLQVIGGVASATADSFNTIQTMAVDDSSSAFAAGTTSLGSPASEFDAAFDATPTRSAQTVTHVMTIPTGSGNFTIRRISLHNDTAANVTGSSTTLVAGIDNVQLTKTSDFSLEITVNMIYSDNT